MAFCNSCGATLDAVAKICPKCGAAQPGPPAAAVAPASPPSAPAAASPAQPTNVLKPVLIALGAVVVVGALAIAALVVFGLHVARHTRIENRNGNVQIESPFGSVESSTDPSTVSRQLGIEIYPGAQLLKGEAANVDVAGVHTVAAKFETSDSPDKVAEFYRSKFPNATYKANGDHYSIVSNQPQNVVTIKIEAADGKTLIKVATVSGANVTGSSSD
jgi:hypothetical protein